MATEQEILSDPAFRLVRDVLDVCEGRDPVDAIDDVTMALSILKDRLVRDVLAAGLPLGSLT